MVCVRAIGRFRELQYRSLLGRRSGGPPRQQPGAVPRARDRAIGLLHETNVPGENQVWLVVPAVPPSPSAAPVASAAAAFSASPTTHSAHLV